MRHSVAGGPERCRRGLKSPPYEHGDGRSADALASAFTDTVRRGSRISPDAGDNVGLMRHSVAGGPELCRRGLSERCRRGLSERCRRGLKSPPYGCGDGRSADALSSAFTDTVGRGSRISPVAGDNVGRGSRSSPATV